jgi:hypothetical protein
MGRWKISLLFATACLDFAAPKREMGRHFSCGLFLAATIRVRATAGCEPRQIM